MRKNLARSQRSIYVLIATTILILCAFRVNAQQTAQTQKPQDEDYRIHLKAMIFDPLRGAGNIAAELRLPEGTAVQRRIIQFRAPLTRDQRQMLTSQYGLKLTDYIPNLAYLERIPDDLLTKLKQVDLVRAIVPYQPAFKISPTIGKLKFHTEERRKMRGLLLVAVLFDDADPQQVATSIRGISGITNIEVEDLRKSGAPARIRFTASSQSVLPEIARLDGVRWIEEVAEQMEDNGNTAGTIQSGTPGNTPIWDRGIHGEGQIIGVIDSGAVDIGHCFFEDPTNNTPGPTHRKVLEVRPAINNGHSTFVAGIALGDDFNNPGATANRGNAWAARLVSGGRAEGIFNALTSNNAQGVRINTNSWHDNTNGAGNPALYNLTASDADTFTWNNEDHVVLGSMGNNGEEQGPPGTAKNSIGVNASQRDPNEMNVGDGNPGPTADGRRKPDVVTPGCNINSSQISTACTIQLSNVCATSWATPAAAATTALIRQYYAEGWYPTGTPQPSQIFTPTGALIKATLLNATIDMTGVAGYPSNNEGWGLARLNNTLFFPGSARELRAWDIRHADGLATGEFRAFAVDVASSTQPLKVTLVWTEPPGAANAVNPVVNNLNLTVIAPDGTTFLGNVFAGGQSTTGGTADALNNVEQFLINAPAVGNWTIRVAAPAVNVGQPSQGFAVVATARMSAPQIQVPGSLSMTGLCIGGNSIQTLNVCNTGVGNLIVDPITSSNPSFSVTTPTSGYPVTISPDFCFPFQVVFNAGVAGAQSTVLTIPTNDPDHPNTIVNVSGDVGMPDIRVTGSTDFGIHSAWTPAEKRISVCNTGSCDLTVSSATVACPDFTLINNPFPAKVSPDSCLDVVVRFTPVEPYSKSCDLTIASNDPDTPSVTRTLTGKTPPLFSVHSGLVIPHGALNNIAKVGSSINVDFVYPFTHHWAWDLRVGFSHFDGEPALPDIDVTSVLVNVKYIFNPSGSIRVFGNGGGGMYHFDPGDFEGGGNLGFGVNVPVGRLFQIEGTYNHHWAFTASPVFRFSQIQAGLLVSF